MSRRSTQQHSFRSFDRTRRSFIDTSCLGFTGLVAAALMAQEDRVAADHPLEWQAPDGLPHRIPKAKSVIWLFMNGGVSQAESFDPKPALTQYAGKSINETPFADVQNPEKLKLARVTVVNDANATQNAAAELNSLLINGPFAMAYGMAEGTPHNAHVQLRGEPSQPGDEVPRGLILALGGQPLPENTPGSGRLELAQWLTRPPAPDTPWRIQRYRRESFQAMSHHRELSTPPESMHQLVSFRRFSCRVS